MDESLSNKVDSTIVLIQKVWERVKKQKPFIAFSTGKDSLLVAAMVYEAVAPERPVCLYSHHDLEFSSNLEYLKIMQDYFDIQMVHPFLNYFELMDRGIGFLTLQDPWCVPMLVGTGILDWLQKNGFKSPETAFMFRGMSGAEYSNKFHATLEFYKRLNLPTMNPLLHFQKDEIYTVIKERYHLPLNPIYKHMDRTYCICCYTSDNKRQEYSGFHYPEICSKYYSQIDSLLFGSGLVERSSLMPKFKTREEKICNHGFVHWMRTKEQNKIGAVKYRLSGGGIVYVIRDESWIKIKHLIPVEGKWIRKGAQITFWNLPERITDCLIKRMINCLDCGFCVVECFHSRHFNRETRELKLTNCLKCGKCLSLEFCMGWKHRFWRRIIVEGKQNE